MFCTLILNIVSSHYTNMLLMLIYGTHCDPLNIIPNGEFTSTYIYIQTYTNTHPYIHIHLYMDKLKLQINKQISYNL